jgi:hypothetical protein
VYDNDDVVVVVVVVLLLLLLLPLPLLVVVAVNDYLKASCMLAKYKHFQATDLMQKVITSSHNIDKRI